MTNSQAPVHTIHQTGRRHYCTYFDSRYLPRGLALYKSLERHGGDFVLWVLCLDETCRRVLGSLGLPHLRPVPMAELEAADPELLSTKSSRTIVEYYFTCSPCWPRYILTLVDSPPDEITYLDSDLYFFSSPEPVFAELGNGSVAIIPHRFSPGIENKFCRFGIYNVGWLTFRATPDGLACLAWWRNRCLEWCYDKVESDRYADQKYLDRFQELFSGVAVIGHPGANLAPWNLGRHEISEVNGNVLVDKHPLIFFHFQGISRITRRIFDTNLVPYRTRMTSTIRRTIYLPYLMELYLLLDRFAPVYLRNQLRKKATLSARIINRTGRILRLIQATFAGSLVRVPNRAIK